MLPKLGKLQKIFFAFFLALLIQGLEGKDLQAVSPKEIPIKGQVNLVEIWSNYCLPCKMMAPVMANVEKNYKGKAAIVNLDVDKFPDQIKRFGIHVIPTQIFFDPDGKEVYRHEGFLSEKDIGAQFKKMGVN
jgi:thioredoxin 1